MKDFLSKEYTDYGTLIFHHAEVFFIFLFRDLENQMMISFKVTQCIQQVSRIFAIIYR